MTRTQQILMKNSPELLSMMEESLSIYDQSLYFLRQAYFDCTKNDKSIKTPNFKELYNLVKETDKFKNSKLDFYIKTMSFRQAYDNWNYYIKAVMRYKRNQSGFTSKPKIPKYLHRSKKYNLITIDKSRFQTRNCQENEIKLPKSNFKFKIPPNIEKNSIKCLRILKFYNKIKIEIIYEKKPNPNLDNLNLNSDSALGIDLGVNNLMAITSNDKNLSYIVQGRPLKSMNQYYNKKKSGLSSKKAHSQIQRLNLKRKNKISNYLHNASKKIVDLCLENQIGTIVIGHNKGWKQKSKMGKKNNQNFITIPFNNLIEMIKYKAEEVGITVKITEESYTSKVDHLALEEIKHQEVYSGKRVKRGLFRSSTGKLLNADINGAIGILRKIKAITDEQLMFLRDRGDIVSPELLNVI